MNALSKIKEKLVVSCQALPDEPLHGSEIMARMALAAKAGGAAGIRANTVVDISAIKNIVDLPVIGIIKQVYDNSSVYITPTIKEVEQLVEVGVEIIAIDATDRIRPDNVSINELVFEVKKRWPQQLIMADIATIQEAKVACAAGFDCVGTTLVGYTDSTKGQQIFADDFKIFRNILNSVECPVIAEGNILTPEHASRVIEIGAWAVVVGGAITRPQQITTRFVAALNNKTN